MPSTTTRVIVLISFGLFLVVTIAFAVVEHETVRYDRSVQSIRGRITASDQPMRVVWVDVYDNAELCLDSSIPPAERRKHRTKIASVEPDSNGRFQIKHLPKGFYEVEFGNHARGGYNILSVLINVDPKGTTDSVCVDLSLEGGGGQSSVAECSAKK